MVVQLTLLPRQLQVQVVRVVGQPQLVQMLTRGLRMMVRTLMMVHPRQHHLKVPTLILRPIIQIHQPTTRPTPLPPVPLLTLKMMDPPTQTPPPPTRHPSPRSQVQTPNNQLRQVVILRRRKH